MNSKQSELLLMIPLQGMSLGLTADEIMEVLEESIKIGKQSKQIAEQLSLNE